MKLDQRCYERLLGKYNLTVLQKNEEYICVGSFSMRAIYFIYNLSIIFAKVKILLEPRAQMFEVIVYKKYL